MSRKERARGRPDPLAALLASGDHGGAARAAAAVVEDPAASEAERAGARAVRSSLAPEPLALAAGLTGIALALAIGIWVALGGAR